MSRYVEYDSLVADSYESDMWDRGTQRFNLRVVEVDDIENAPSIDLVRCGECKYWRNIVPTRCTKHFGILVNADDFCSYGKRRTDE
jgi:hypothetical protein